MILKPVNYNIDGLFVDKKHNLQQPENGTFAA